VEMILSPHVPLRYLETTYSTIISYYSVLHEGCNSYENSFNRLYILFNFSISIVFFFLDLESYMLNVIR